MPEIKMAPVEALREAIIAFGNASPGSILHLTSGQRLVNQGDPSNHCFLITQGTLNILVRQEDGTELPVAFRTEGGLIGETALLQRQGLRNASVQVATSTATVIRFSRSDMLSLLRHDPSLYDGITEIWELAATRREETLEVLGRRIIVENRVMTVLISDIHNFSALGESAWEEQSNSFLFEFVEESEMIAGRFQGLFEDQGDGSKIVFGGPGHADRAIESALEIADFFSMLRCRWVQRSDVFAFIGLGIGICTDCMSVRRRGSALDGKGRIISHTINVAAAFSKFQVAKNQIEIYTDHDTALMAKVVTYNLDGPHNKYFQRLSRFVAVYRVLSRGSTSGATKAVELSMQNFEGVISILFLASQPSDEVQLRVDAEAREIQEKLRLSKYRDRFSFEKRGAVRPEDLSQSLLDIEPTVVHFSGHGASSGELIFEDKLGSAHPILPPALAALFREFANKIRCVVLNACYSEVQASAIVRHIDYVIGMDKGISDDAATAFSVGFYQALGAGKSVDEAYRLGCVQIGLQSSGASESMTPVLKRKAEGWGPGSATPHRGV